MPELPEVEANTRTVRPLVEHRRIRCVHVFHPIATKSQTPAHLARLAQDRRIQSVTRLGKYLLLSLDRGILTMHFRLDGQLLWFCSAKYLLRRANQAVKGVHVDVALELDKGVLGFADGRHFGCLRLRIRRSLPRTPKSRYRRSLQGFHAALLRKTRRHLAPPAERIPARSIPSSPALVTSIRRSLSGTHASTRAAAPIR
jgi:hypothetical protein